MTSTSTSNLNRVISVLDKLKHPTPAEIVRRTNPPPLTTSKGCRAYRQQTSTKLSVLCSLCLLFLKDGVPLTKTGNC